LQVSAGVVLLLLKLFSFLFEFSKSYSISLDFVLNYFNSCVAKFVLKKELMELSEVGVSVKDIKQIQGKVKRLLVVVAQRSTQDRQKTFVIDHVLHVLN
jgi:hypothetical protein